VKIIENIEKLEREAEENLNIAQHEISIARKIKELAKIQLKQSKARENLFNNELKIAKIREKLARKKMEISNKKRKLKEDGILSFSEDELIGEGNYAIFYENLAKLQLSLAKIHEKIVEIERKTIGNKKAISNIRFNLAKELKVLTKKINYYITTIRTNKPSEIISKAKAEIQEKRKQITLIKKGLTEEENKLKSRQNKIADLKKELSLNLAEQEKIRHKKS